MTDDDFELNLSELTSAEDFLEYFGIDHESSVVQINRLHILQRFHDYLDQIDEMPDSVQAKWALYADRLRAAYQDFLTSDARTEKVFRVFRMHEPRRVAIPLNDLMESRPHATRV